MAHGMVRWRGASPILHHENDMVGLGFRWRIGSMLYLAVLFGVGMFGISYCAFWALAVATHDRIWRTFNPEARAAIAQIEAYCSDYVHRDVVQREEYDRTKRVDSHCAACARHHIDRVANANAQGDTRFGCSDSERYVF